MTTGKPEIVADWVARHLRAQGVERLFLFPGGTIVPIIDACLKIGIGYECFKSEQGAAYAALAVARLSGRPQVVMVTSGPGATNVLTPVADAYYDSTPLVVITGQIGSVDLGSRPGVRQRGFQETPTVAMAGPVTKMAACMLSESDVFKQIPAAFALTMSGRRGPVLIDFPMDIQRRALAEPVPDAAVVQRPLPVCPPAKREDVRDIAAGLTSARRPVLLLGQGALTSGSVDRYRRLADRLESLTCTSFLGVGCIATTDARHLGYVGHTGHLAANRAVHEADFLLVLGSRLDVRQTGTMVKEFVPSGDVAWIDIDRQELDNPRVAVKWRIEADAAAFCDELLDALPERLDSHRLDQSWQNAMLALKEEHWEDRPGEGPGLAPRTVLRTLARIVAGSEPTVTTGVGCHQHWAARHLPFGPGLCRLLSSGGHGAMGYDLPSAIGAAMHDSSRPVLCVVGDGSLLMNIQELAALQERRLPVKVLLLNNSRLGLVSQFQLLTWGADPTTGDYPSPDFTAIARAFGIAAERLAEPSQIQERLEWLWGAAGPALLEVIIDQSADVTPMLLGGQTMAQMWMGRLAL
jgi:acetolactate synthase-1/2/3 large subunit